MQAPECSSTLSPPSRVFPPSRNGRWRKLEQRRRAMWSRTWPVASAAVRASDLSPERRAVELLRAARASDGFRHECDVGDELAAKPIAMHPKVDACTNASAFAMDPAMMDVRFYCVIDIGTFLFL